MIPILIQTNLNYSVQQPNVTTVLDISGLNSHLMKTAGWAASMMRLNDFPSNPETSWNYKKNKQAHIPKILGIHFIPI